MKINKKQIIAEREAVQRYISILGRIVAKTIIEITISHHNPFEKLRNMDYQDFDLNDFMSTVKDKDFNDYMHKMFTLIDFDFISRDSFFGVTEYQEFVLHIDKRSAEHLLFILHLRQMMSAENLREYIGNKIDDQEYVEVITHELQHSYDYFISKGKFGLTDKKFDPKKVGVEYRDTKNYLTSPSEINTRLSQALGITKLTVDTSITDYVNQVESNFQHYEFLSPKDKKNIVRKIAKFYHYKMEYVKNGTDLSETSNRLMMEDIDFSNGFNMPKTADYHQLQQVANISDLIVYQILNKMYEEAILGRFNKEYSVVDLNLSGIGKFIGRDNNIDPKLKNFVDGLKDLTIIFKDDIDDSSEYNFSKGKHIITLNYRYTNIYQNLSKFVTNTDNGKHTKFGLKYNLLPLKQKIRKLLGKPEYDVSTFERFIATCDVSIYKDYLNYIGKTITHELRHMYDNISTNGDYRRDKDSLEYYKDTDANKSMYLKLRHEVDARIQQAIYKTRKMIDNVDTFEEYWKLFVNGYNKYDFKALKPEMKSYVRSEAEEFFNNSIINPQADHRHSLFESVEPMSKKDILNKGIDICCEDLGVDRPIVHLLEDKEFTRQHKSFAAYSPSLKEVYCVIEGRNTADCMRSIAHELMHHKQNLEGRLTETAGKDGDDFENEANTYAGVIMRRLGRELPNIFEDHTESGLKINECKRITKKSFIQESVKEKQENFITNLLNKFI